VTPTVGIVGGGQLARMLLPAAARLDLAVTLLADPSDSAVPFCRDVVPGIPDAQGLRRLAERCEVMTVEHELVDLEVLAELQAAGTEVRPSPAALGVAVDKVRQHELLGDAGVPTAPWAVATTSGEIDAFAIDHGWSLVLKRPRGGYDGRGVFVVSDREQAAAVLTEVAGPLLVEPALPIECELAVLVARRPGGELVVYDPAETVQADGMCREVLLPAPIDAALAAEARDVARTAAMTVGSVGVLSVELFVVDGHVVLNELAARPHNGGHPTIEGAVTSQFENHLRAVADLPLGNPAVRAPTAMVNVVGEARDPRERLAVALEIDDVAIHLYGKAYRRGRKLGHVTAVGPDLSQARDRAGRAAALLMRGSAG
jgi:5-(carboxyamino)imidazole ribonucleotide synthase